jgi:maleate cis-trans isomerase
MSKRLGVALLSSDLVLEPELRRVMPYSVSTYVARVDYPEGVTDESLSIAAANLDLAVRSLLPVRPHAMVWACTSGSFFHGPAFNTELEARMKRAAGGLQCFTATTAVVTALKSLAVRRLSILTPYSRSINEQLADFLGHEGFEVAKMEQLFEDTDISDFELQTLPADEIHAACVRATTPDADALAVVCTGLALVEQVESLERELGQPVISSNLAIMYKALQDVGYREPIVGFGTLLAQRRA